MLKIISGGKIIANEIILKFLKLCSPSLKKKKYFSEVSLASVGIQVCCITTGHKCPIRHREDMKPS